MNFWLHEGRGISWLPECTVSFPRTLVHGVPALRTLLSIYITYKEYYRPRKELYELHLLPGLWFSDNVYSREWLPTFRRNLLASTMIVLHITRFSYKISRQKWTKKIEFLDKHKSHAAEWKLASWIRKLWIRTALCANKSGSIDTSYVQSPLCVGWWIAWHTCWGLSLGEISKTLSCKYS
jgi:hypothetical protein